MGDTYVSKGQTAAMGPNAHVHDVTFNQIWSQSESDIDLVKLAGELSQLRAEVKKDSVNPEADIAIGELAKAQIEAKNGNGPKVLEHLKNAGKWTLGVAEKIGTSVAAAAIKTAIGM